MINQEYTRITRTGKTVEFIYSSCDEDIIEMGDWFISNEGYAVGSILVDGKRVKRLLHRLILKAEKGEIVDHINGDKLDNRRDNLRKVTCSQNNANRRIQKNNTSGYPGVTWCISNKKWRVLLKMNNIRYNIGYFKNYELAVEARKNAEVKYFNEYRREHEEIK